MHGPSAYGGPIGEGPEVVAVFPGKLKEFSRVEIGGFFAEERFEAPLDVGASPRLKAVPAGGEPIEFYEVPHRYGCRQLTTDEL